MDSRIGNGTVLMSRRGDIAIVVVDNPPVNAGSPRVKADLTEAMRALLDKPGIAGVVLTGANNSFIAGADLSEFDQPVVPPVLPDLLNFMEASSTPIICAIDGAAYGGGYEVALGCDYRIATPRALVGLPEVTLGIIPGGGGTQRLPRLTGMAQAIDLIITGRRVAAPEALRLGMIDAIAKGDLIEDAIALLRSRGGKRDLLKTPVPPGAAGTIEAVEAKLLPKAARNPAAAEAARLVRLAATLPAAEALAEERETFTRLRLSSVSRALRYLFFAERAAAKLAGVSGRSTRSVKQVGILGAGTMGAGIAVAAARAGFAVTVVERDQQTADAGTARIADIGRARGALKAVTLEVQSDFNTLATADLIIEAAFEDMQVKRDLFRRLDAVAKPGAILASNTSYLDVNQINAVTARPADVIGLHFFSPAHIMKLLEIVRAGDASDDTMLAALRFAKELGKIPVVAGVCEGFIGNRIFSVYRKQCEFMLHDGIMPDVIDAALEANGWAMGPFAVSDLAGLDIGWATRKRLASTRKANERYVAIADRICEAGDFGRKTGRGWYVYEGERRAGLNPAVLQFAKAEGAGAGRPVIARDAQSIALRALAAMVNEAAHVLAEGVAQRASDIDIVFTRGYGYAAEQGGPIFAAREIGAPRIIAEIEELVRENGEGWCVAANLRGLLAPEGAA